jgi:hypothetical protein
VSQNKRRVAFARINRRVPTKTTLSLGSFTEETKALLESRETRALIKERTEQREWIAADLELDPSGDFMMGVLGFSHPKRLTDFDEETFSWIKGERRTEHGASERTMVPVAIDLREDHRWVAFATAYRVRPPSFAKGLVVLTRAVTEAGRLPVEWDVDLVTDITDVEEWLAHHPDVYNFERFVRFPNPVRTLDDDREEMQKLAADRNGKCFKRRPEGSSAKGSRLVGPLEGTEPRGPFLDGCAGEGIDAVGHLCVNEALRFHDHLPPRARQGAGNSAGPQIDVIERRSGMGLSTQMTARSACSAINLWRS